MKQLVQQERVISPKRLESSDTCALARALIGMYLVQQSDGEQLAHLITEVEAYDGPHDLASHAARGRTKRNDIMFGPAGHWYVYLCYGMHWMLNIVTGPVDYPAAILIRGVLGATGPGRVTRLLTVTGALNAHSATPASGLWIEDRGVTVPHEVISVTPRIGVAYAREWAAKPMRFVLDTNTSLSCDAA